MFSNRVSISNKKSVENQLDKKKLYRKASVLLIISILVPTISKQPWRQQMIYNSSVTLPQILGYLC